MIKKWIPNLISTTRGIVIAPALYYFTLHHSWGVAFWLLLAGGITDALDGLVAGWLNARSKVGKYFFDPGSDGALILGAMFALVQTKKLPLWILFTAGGIGLAFTLLIHLGPRRVSRIAEGVFPFCGVSAGAGIVAIYGYNAFYRPYTDIFFYALICAVVAAVALILIKRPRLREAIDNIKDR
jgi:phosphatidylglycerophosphate synthase